MNDRSVPKTERNIFTTRVDALRPDDPPLGVPARADNNVMKITENCLFMRPSTGQVYGGPGGMSWWSTWLSVVMGIAAILFGYFGCSMDIAVGRYTGTVLGCALENGYFWVSLLITPVSSIWMFVPWRRQLPIIFNRKTGKVTGYHKGKVYVQDWKSLKAYVKDITSVVYGGFTGNEGVLSIAFSWRDPETGEENYLGLPIYGTSETSEALRHRGIYRAARVWEYIRLFMKEGKSSLPPIVFCQDPFIPQTKYCPESVREALSENFPSSLLHVKPYWLPLSIPFFILALPVCAIWMLTDLSYFCLDCILPRRKWPKELLEACDHVWDGSNDYGPRSDDAQLPIQMCNHPNE